MIKAFIFDFDGLIIDTESVVYQSWLEIYKTYNVDLPLSKWESIIGSSNNTFDPFEYLDQHTKLNINQPSLLSRFEKTLQEKTRSLPMLPGVVTYLKWAKKNNLFIGLASSSTRMWVSSHLNELGIETMFDIIRTSEDVNNVKPFPDLYLSVKKFLCLDDYEAVVFEDSRNGIIAANKAKFFTIAVPNAMTRNMDLSAANFILNTLSAVDPENLVKNTGN